MKRETKHVSIDLCDSCQYAMKIYGYGNEIKLCSRIGDSMGGVSSQVHFPVEKCTSYELRGALSRYELENMAIHIEKKKDSPGFRFSRLVNGSEVEIK